MQLLNLTKDGEDIFCALPPMEGPVKISTSTGKKTRIKFKGNPRKEVERLFKVIALGNDSALYKAPYEIYFHDFEENKSEFILRTPDNSHYQVIRPDSTWNTLLFSTSSDGLFMYNRKTKELTDLKEKLIN